MARKRSPLGEMTTDDTLFLVKSLGYLVLGLITLGVTIFRTTPVDIYSTALWMDSLGYNIVFDQSSPLLGIISFPHNATDESVFLALGMYAVVIALWLKLEQMGDWVEGDNMPFAIFAWRYIQGSIDSRRVNWSKVGVMFLVIVIVVFDTSTDAHWKTGGIFPLALFTRNWIISFFFQTVGSEVLWIIGSLFLFSSLSGIWRLVKSKRGSGRPSAPSSTGSGRPAQPMDLSAIMGQQAKQQARPPQGNNSRSRGK